MTSIRFHGPAKGPGARPSPAAGADLSHSLLCLAPPVRPAREKEKADKSWPQWGEGRRRNSRHRNSVNLPLIAVVGDF
jgi:hypothetical protein